MSEFKQFAAVVAERFAKMVETGDLFRTNVGADNLWDAYLAAFPEGTNPIFRVRTEHDGSYDRNFIKRVGGVVAINDDGTIQTVWDDYNSLPYPYNEVAATLHELVVTSKIDGLFRTKERTAGHKPNFEEIDGKQHMWNHFYVELPRFAISEDAGAIIGQNATNVGVMRRGLTEITMEAIETYKDLSGSIYRGTEFLPNVMHLHSAKKLWDATPESRKDILLWANYKDTRLLIKNTAVGTLLVNLSEGMPVEQAVAAFESMVAPTNYRRTIALITPAMVQNAMDKINELGIENALYRRHATLADLNINDVLWADASAKNIMAGSIGDILMQSAVKKAPASDKAEEISIEGFLSTVLPKAASMEIFVKNELQKNLVNITAAKHVSTAPLFKWGNQFAWSYRGNLTDSIKENVKAAGGNINADLRVSLAWHNSDDLDLHCVGPQGHIYFGNKMGILDVDTNGGGPSNSINPVENLAFMRPKDGIYNIHVHQYNARDNNQSKPGFTLQVECQGQLHEVTYSPAVKGKIECFQFTMKNGALESLKVIDSKLIHVGQSQKVSGIETESFVRVSSALLSPNYWGGKAIGNKHYIFLLEGARTDESVRGIYNEFLTEELNEHRKVFEVLGAKTMIEPEGEQLAGLGFSSTIRAEALFKVQGPSINKTYKVKF
ncbi:hypothetical protein PP761_gp33 [Stenotrophomonas phage Paxi]|uniref:Uncharacterized protein n=1 Tax=Stenotrophomonas phage Paxi TaxID=2859653 RepID=A0AAE7WLS2_9CAUD|nr:hypothetical protein PP761_gp33 [Stenotrophomonas phage Paxi]QYW01804.1 hypothetical protein CPT_Paxi_033 [Stenotrophomonas phage Paxi]